VYGIACSGERTVLGQIGIDGHDVYTVPHRDICAVVHDCPAEPYDSDDYETVKSWVTAHQRVLDRAEERLGHVVPVSFDTILQDKDGTGPRDSVLKWLAEEYERLCGVIRRTKGKHEYGVQVLYQPAVARAQASEQSGEVAGMQQHMATRPAGIAYIYKQRMEKSAREEMRKAREQWRGECLRRIGKHVDEIAEAKPKKTEGDQVMLLNISCLVREEKADALARELEQIDSQEGVSVRFTGPWPPYSFTGNLKGDGEDAHAANAR
jgi:hypothetical protein